jgi:hypothetical protein
MDIYHPGKTPTGMTGVKRSNGRSRLAVGVALHFIAFAACATGRGAFPPDTAVRPARELPDQFVVQGTAGEPATSSDLSSRACRNPLVDARDGTRLRLIRSQEGKGDYEVPGAQYGLSAGDLLRVDCTTNRAIGIVPRGR